MSIDYIAMIEECRRSIRILDEQIDDLERFRKKLQEQKSDIEYFQMNKLSMDPAFWKGKTTTAAQAIFEETQNKRVEKTNEILRVISRINTDIEMYKNRRADFQRRLHDYLSKV